ncbi:MAG TPA: preprotein translocase subunit SecE [Dehalococcoidia bacterium]|nr:preprotein translocase subunit SecE [Dehalococcoidia bacterium]
MAKKGQSQVTKLKKSRFAFVGDIIGELRKVVWPTKQEALRLTIMVLIVCITVGLILGAIDYGFAELVAKVFLGGS